LTKDDLDKIIYIRNQGHTVTEAINRQLAHYPYHIGLLRIKRVQKSPRLRQSANRYKQLLDPVRAMTIGAK
jgi:hypothetical protein